MGKFLMILGASIITCLGFLSFGYPEEQITITTYYPSPYGSYQELNVNNSLAVGPNARTQLDSAWTNKAGIIYSSGNDGVIFWGQEMGGGEIYGLYNPTGSSLHISRNDIGDIVALSPDGDGLNFNANQVSFRNDDDTPATIRAREVIFCASY